MLNNQESPILLGVNPHYASLAKYETLLSKLLTLQENTPVSTSYSGTDSVAMLRLKILLRYFQIRVDSHYPKQEG